MGVVPHGFCVWLSLGTAEQGSVGFQIPDCVGQLDTGSWVSARLCKDMGLK